MAYTIPESTHVILNEATLLHDIRAFCAKAERRGVMFESEKAELAELQAKLKKERGQR